jgi:hypothetical protein
MFLQFETANLLQRSKNTATILHMRAFLHAPFVSSTLRKGGFAPNRKARGIFFARYHQRQILQKAQPLGLQTVRHVQTPQTRRLPEENPQRQGL